MRYKLGSDWADVIAQETTKTIYQQAECRIYVEEEGSSVYDIDTGEWTGGELTVLYEGQCRLSGIRWGRDFRNTHVANASALNELRVQIPMDESVGLIPRGAKVHVTKCPTNPGLVGQTPVVSTQFQGSATGARTIHCRLDSDIEG